MSQTTPSTAPATPPALESLQSLLAFVDSGSVAGAAKRLGLPQPTLSRRLAPFQKRDAGGEAILVHRGRNLQLTEKGHAALPAIRDLVRQSEQLGRFLKGSEAELQTVRLGIGSFGAEHYLPWALAELRRRKVICEVQSQVVRGQERIIGVVEGRFDVALVTHDPRLIQAIVSTSAIPRAKLAIESLTPHTFCVLASSRTPFAAELKATPANRPVPLALLAQSEFVGLDSQSGIRLQLEAEFRRIGLPLRFVPQASAGGWSAAKEYARHGLGAAIVPLAALVSGDDRLFAIRRLPERFAVTDYLIRRHPRPETPEPALLAALRDAARQHAKELRETWKTLV